MDNWSPYMVKDFGKGFEKLTVLKNYLDKIRNLFTIGRNGLHRYNNQDHSMLTAFYAVEAILDKTFEKEKIWQVNIEPEYHEEKR